MHDNFFHWRITSQVMFKSLSAVPSISFQKANRYGTRFKLWCFYSHHSLELENLLQNYPDFFAKHRYFKWRNLWTNLWILESRKLELFCLAKIAEDTGTEVSVLFQIIGLEVYLPTKNTAIWNKACFLKLHTWYSAEIFKCKLWTGPVMKMLFLPWRWSDLKKAFKKYV